MEKEVMMNAENVREAYEAPKCEMIEMQNEGVLCASDVIEGSQIGSFGENDFKGGWDY